MKQFVIIGGGIAACGCVEGIVSQMKKCNESDFRIFMICGEKTPVYCRPLISYYLEGKTDLEKMKYRPDNFYTENNCELIYDTAVKIDCTEKKVFLENCSPLSYDELCVATGSSPFIPPMKGLERVKNCFSFMTEADAINLENAITPDSKVLIVGAGLIGLKCAEGVVKRVNKVTVCDLAPRILSSILDDTCASLMEKPLADKGVDFLLGDTVANFPDEHTAEMQSGKTIHFDTLVVAVGVKANISLVKEAGAETGRGILIDTMMKTTLPNVYAAGDCTEGYDASIQANRVLAILPNAYMQGKTAGINMAGGNDVFDNAVPMNAIGFFGYHALTCGSYDGEMTEIKDAESIRRFFVKDNTLKGFMLLGKIDKAGIYTSLVRNKTKLSPEKMHDIIKNPSLVPLGKDYRDNILGGTN